MQGKPAWVIHVLALALLASRIIHAIGVSPDKDILPFRVAGAASTFLVLVVSALILLVSAFR